MSYREKNIFKIVENVAFPGCGWDQWYIQQVYVAGVYLIVVRQDDSKWMYGRFDVDAMFGIARELTGTAGIGNGIGMRWIVAVNRVNRKGSNRLSSLILCH